MINCFNEMKTDLLTVKEIFDKDNFYRVPDYQRGFAWNEQFTVFWDDIYRLYKNKEKKKHYMGMLSLEEISSELKKHEHLFKNDQKGFYVVDGQQRLTSIVIMLKAILEYIKGFIDSNDNEDKQKVIDQLKMVLGISDDEMTTYRFDYSINRNDASKTFFKTKIYGDQEEKYVDLYARNINDAKEFIDTKLKQFNLADTIEITKLILDRLVFNIYFINQEFDVRVTFETMNNRGKKLSNLELLKNRLMYLTTFLNDNFGKRLIDQINQIWTNIYKNLCYEDYQLNDDEFLQAHWIVYGKLDKSRGDSYIRNILNDVFSIDENGEFNKKLHPDNKTDAMNMIAKYIKSLEEYSKYWGIINNPSERSNYRLTPDETKWLDKLTRLPSIKFAKATVMTVAGNKFFSEKQKVNFYKKLEQSIFINRLIGQNRNDYSVLIQHAKNILDAQNSEKAINELNNLSNLFKDANAKISIHKNNVVGLIKSFGTDIGNKDNLFYDWNGLIYFLYQYNESLKEKFKDGKSIEWKNIQNESIEHILPQTTKNNTYWKTVLSQINGNEKINKYKNSLGNLLILSQSQNSSVQNASFPDKCGKDLKVELGKFAYQYGSFSAKQVCEYIYWTLHSIYDRQEKLLNFMFHEWFSDLFQDNNDFKKILKKYLPIVNNIKETKEITEKLDKINNQCKKEQEAKSKISGVATTHENDDGWFKKIKPYFKDEYIVRKKSKLTYRENNFTFKRATYSENYFNRKRPNTYIESTYMKDNIYYNFNYNLTDGFLSVWYNNKKYLISDESEADDLIKYYIETFKRILSREEFNVADQKSEPYLWDGTCGTDKEKEKQWGKSNEYVRDKYYESRQKFKRGIELYDKLCKSLKDKLDEKNLDFKICFAEHYIMYHASKNFAEFHIYKDKVRINIRDLGDNIDSDLYKKLPNAGKDWVINHQITVNDENNIDAAVDLILESYKVAEGKQI